MMMIIMPVNVKCEGEVLGGQWSQQDRQGELILKTYFYHKIQKILETYFYHKIQKILETYF